MTMTREISAFGKIRTAGYALAFLDQFLPNRQPVNEEYPVPESQDPPGFVFQTDLETNASEPYALYWNDASPSQYDQAMLFYTRDGKIIMGLSCEESVLEEKYRQLREYSGSQWILYGWEQHPPDSSEAFLKLCRNSPARGPTPPPK